MRMPEDMGRLTSLQCLTNFTVGYAGSSIRELGALQDLHGSLSVSMLQNISSVSDASAANLKAMQYLDELELEWSCNSEDSATDPKEVLENLEPSGGFKRLAIRFYGAATFPKWLGGSSLLKITSLHLGDCHNCVVLPPLGQLSLLEHLIVERFSGIEWIGLEFFGVVLSGCNPSQSLKTLKFGEMPNWKEWLEAEDKEFPCLEEFYIIDCPKFTRDLPKSLPALKKLVISNCENFVTSLPWTDKHCVLNLDASYQVQKEIGDKILSETESDDEVESQSSSSMTEISGKELLLEEIGTIENPEEERAVHEEPESSGKREIASIGSYEHIPKQLGTSLLSYITFLCVSDNNNFSSLPPLGQLPFLKHLIIQRFGGVRSIGPEFYWIDLPVGKPFQSLKTLKFEAISQWELWTPFEVEGEEFPRLQQFHVINCPKLVGDLPKCLPSLTILEISECQQLAALLPWISEYCILKLENCDKVQIRSNHNAPQTTHPEQDHDLSSEDVNQQFPSSAPVMELPMDLQSL
ncbi:hypothetical protein DITRI_Ditri18aG0011400 [Diplodiscus trichospermus]